MLFSQLLKQRRRLGTRGGRATPSWCVVHIGVGVTFHHWRVRCWNRAPPIHLCTLIPK